MPEAPAASFEFRFLFKLDPKGDEPAKGAVLQRAGRALGMTAGVGPDLLCLAQVAELTMETLAMLLGSGLWFRDSQDCHSLVSGTSKHLGLTLSSTQHFTSPNHFFCKAQLSPPPTPNKLSTLLFLACSSEVQN